MQSNFRTPAVRIMHSRCLTAVSHCHSYHTALELTHLHMRRIISCAQLGSFDLISMGTSIGKKIGNQLNMSSLVSLFLVCVGRWMEQVTDFFADGLS